MNPMQNTLKYIAKHLTNGDIDAALNELPEVTVYTATQGRAFGGHEEGGWYFNYSVPHEKQRIKGRMMRLDEAITYCRRGNAIIRALIDPHLPPLCSSLSEGLPVYLYTHEAVPMPLPRYKPHYE